MGKAKVKSKNISEQIKKGDKVYLIPKRIISGWGYENNFEKEKEIVFAECDGYKESYFCNKELFIFNFHSYFTGIKKRLGDIALLSKVDDPYQLVYNSLDDIKVKLVNKYIYNRVAEKIKFGNERKIFYKQLDHFYNCEFFINDRKVIRTGILTDGGHTENSNYLSKQKTHLLYGINFYENWWVKREDILTETDIKMLKFLNYGTRTVQILEKYRESMGIS